jgi:hypothetical protein
MRRVHDSWASIPGRISLPVDAALFRRCGQAQENLRAQDRRISMRRRSQRWRFVVSHPCDRRDVAWMGHPFIWGWSKGGASGSPAPPPRSPKARDWGHPQLDKRGMRPGPPAEGPGTLIQLGWSKDGAPRLWGWERQGKEWAGRPPMRVPGPWGVFHCASVGWEATVATGALHILETSRRSMWKSRPKPCIGPCPCKGAYHRQNHYGNAVANQREERSGACSGQGPTQPKDGSASRVAYAAA